MNTEYNEVLRRYYYDQWFRCYFVHKKRKQATYWFEKTTNKKYDAQYEKQIVRVINFFMKG